MHRNKQIAIILSDTLRSIGLQSLLTDYFPPVEVCYFPNFEMLSSTGSDTYDYYFTDSDTLVLNADFFLPRRNKTALLIDSTEEHGALSSTTVSRYVPPKRPLSSNCNNYLRATAPATPLPKTTRTYPAVR